MVRILVALASLVVAVLGQVASTLPSACQEILPEGGCSICGVGSCVTIPDGILPGQPGVTCGVLQDDGFNGRIPLEICPNLTPLIGVCECKAFVPTLAPSTTPTRAPIVPFVAPIVPFVSPVAAPIAPTPPPTSRAPVIPIPPGACPEIPPEGVCSICGAGSCINMPDAIFVFPGQPAISCGMLQDNGFNGRVPLVFCPIITTLIQICECRPFGETLAPSTPIPPPTPFPTPAPTTRAPIIPLPIPPGACQEIPPEGGCSVCGTGSCITKPDAIFLRSFSGQPSFSYCSVLQDAGFNGWIPLDECGILPPLIGDCECQPLVAPTPAPTSAAPTPSPRIVMRLVFSLATLVSMSLFEI